MTRARATFAVLLLATGLAAQARPAGGHVVDALVAVVNGEPIFASQVRDAAWYTRFAARLSRGPRGAAALGPLTAAEQARALRHLEDETLLQQARANEGFAALPPARLRARADAVWPGWEKQAGGAAALAALLAACHLDRAAALAIVERQLSLVAFLNQHFSGDPAPDAAAIQSYYDDTFVPAARARGLRPAPLADVRATIAALLRQRRRAGEEQALLARLRVRATVEARQPW